MNCRCILQALSSLRPHVLFGMVLAISTLVSTNVLAQREIARFELVSGDRPIALARTPDAPSRFRAVDATGQPVAGAAVVIGVVGHGGPWRVDEFGYRGFNAPNFSHYLDPLTMPGGYFFVTDENGEAAGQSDYTDGPSSAFLYGIGTWPSTRSGPQAFMSVVRVATAPIGKPVVVVEYFNAALGHYFVTHLQSEVDALDTGKFLGWQRSVGAFVAYASALDAPAGSTPVCRFSSSRHTSHFYSADQSECDSVVANWPEVWQLETREAFFIHVPDRKTGTCEPGFQPVYRLYAERNGPNHRYVTDRRLRDAMVTAGWIAEGSGVDRAIYCVPG